MALNKQAGNMYPWVTHTWNPVAGCKHDCWYCYMTRGRFEYSMEPRIRDKYLSDKLGEGNTIFVGSAADMWGEFIPKQWIEAVLEACRKSQSNTYLFQSKNPARFREFLGFMPDNVILGTTLETNRETHNISQAPSPERRSDAMYELSRGIGWPFSGAQNKRHMVSVEPIMDFDYEPMLELLNAIRPNIISVGADSKGCNLPEPSSAKVVKLVKRLQNTKIQVYIKSNLRRLLDGDNYVA